MVPELLTAKDSIEARLARCLALCVCFFYVNDCRAYPTVFFIDKIICMYRLVVTTTERKGLLRYRVVVSTF